MPLMRSPVESEWQLRRPWTDYSTSTAATPRACACDRAPCRAHPRPAPGIRAPSSSIPMESIMSASRQEPLESGRKSATNHSSFGGTSMKRTTSSPQRNHPLRNLVLGLARQCPRLLLSALLAALALITTGPLRGAPDASLAVGGWDTESTTRTL